MEERGVPSHVKHTLPFHGPQMPTTKPESLVIQWSSSSHSSGASLLLTAGWAAMQSTAAETEQTCLQLDSLEIFEMADDW